MQRYEAGMLTRTRLFDGMPEVLAELDSAGIRWGVISNKIERLVQPSRDWGLQNDRSAPSAATPRRTRNRIPLRSCTARNLLA